MPRLSRAQEAVRQRITGISAGGYLPEELGKRLLASIQMAIPSDGQRLFGVDPSTLLFTRLLAASASDGPFRSEWLRNIYLQHESVPYAAPPDVMRARLPVVLYQERPERCWGIPAPLLSLLPAREHFRTYHEYGTPAGGALRACFAVDGRWVAMLELMRQDAQRPFTPGDAAFLRRLTPTIGQALAAALAREQALGTTEIAAPDASGILLLTPDKQVTYATPAGEAWLGLLPDAQREGKGFLPTSIWAAIAAMGSASEQPATSTLTVPTAAGMVRIEASPGGADGSVAVVLAPVRPPGPPEVPDYWPLTAQEREVVSLLIQGFSNRRLADALHVSEHTIESHLGHAYEKLGVGSRAQLLAQLFQELYLPNFRLPAGAVGAGSQD